MRKLIWREDLKTTLERKISLYANTEWINCIKSSKRLRKEGIIIHVAVIRPTKSNDPAVLVLSFITSVLLQGGGACQ